MKTSFTFGALAVVAAAVPTGSKQCPAKLQDANFDDLTSLPGDALNPIPTPYKGLYYQGISFTTVVRTGLLPGVLPHSGNNYGAIGLPTMLQGSPMITTNYADSNIASFQLESFYFGCAVQTATGVTALPTACTINVTGYKGNDNTVADSQQVCSQTYSYDPTTMLGVQQQAFGTFDDCAHQDLQFATISFNLPGGLSAASPLSALVIDDVKYTTKAKSC